MIIAIDGTTASGKGTIAAGVASRYGLRRLDTGRLYRALAQRMLDRQLDLRDETAAAQIARSLRIEDIDENQIRSAEAGTGSSIVAVHPSVRDALRDLQRDFAVDPAGAVLDGRDIGTVICPDADVKLFVTADLAARTQRRLNELRARGEQISFEALQAQIAERDRRDTSRADAPLRQAPDAHLLDTTHLSIEGAVEAACRLIDAARMRPRT
jgi:CMP/dCMP kinase